MFRKTPRKRHRQDGNSAGAGAGASSSSSPSDPRPTIIKDDNAENKNTTDVTTKNTQKQQPIRKPRLISANDGASVKSNAETLPRLVNKKPSWYGSWPRKSTASTSVARETILGDTFQPPACTSTANLARIDAAVKRVASNQSLFAAANASSISVNTAPDDRRPTSKIPAAAAGDMAPPSRSKTLPTDYTLNKSPKNTSKLRNENTSTLDVSKVTAQTAIVKPCDVSADPATSITPDESVKPATCEVPKEDEQAAGWFSWLGRSSTAEIAAIPETLGDVSAGQVDGLMDIDDPPSQPETPQIEITTAETQSDPEAPLSYGAWIGSFWYGPGTTNALAAEPEQDQPAEPPKEEEPAAHATVATNTDNHIMSDAPHTITDSVSTANLPSSNSTWAFWSRQPKYSEPTLKHPENGELAVMGEASEDDAKPAAEAEMPKDLKKKKKPKIDDGAVAAMPIIAKNKKRQRETSDQGSPGSVPREGSIRASKSHPEIGLKHKNASSVSLDSDASESTSSSKPNLLLPSFTCTYNLKEQPSIVSQITNLILRSNHPGPDHVFRSAEPPSRPIRKAISIGVHGLFPAAYLRPMVGQPTGTSLRFANLGAEAIARWTGSHGFPDCDIEKVALEGEGKIGERVDNLWKLLLNWLDELKEADLILVSCHSQGVPVGIMLVAKLLGLGVITPSTHIGVCAMAGVCLGPFPDYKSSMGILMGSAAELWEFSNPTSDISTHFEAALKEALRFGVRITFVGSIDDQLVPMESAVYSPAHHPYIYRAVFIDGRLHAPDFIANLVGFALKLRNLGVPDHGLIRELSIPLAGSLYGGEGHSRLYYDDRVYDLALANTLETTAVASGMQCRVGSRERLGVSANPYTLPWVMRGVLEEPLVKTSLHEEAMDLLRQFDAWKPVTKALKDVKYRLEAVRSRL